MGQRHQVYLYLKPMWEDLKDNPNRKPARVFGIHHQWLYGQTAINSLARMLRMIEKSASDGDKDYHFGQGDPDGYTSGDEAEILAAVYSVDPDSGYYHRVHDLGSSIETREWTMEGEKKIEQSAECLDPRCGDNNDGITVIDVSGDRPKYCFMSISEYGIECDESRRRSIPYLKPMTALKYLEAYYPNLEKVHPDTLKSLGYVNGFEVLSLADVKRIFPAMFKRHLEAV